MHEEPYAQALVDMALGASGGKKIAEIVLAVGRFSAINPSAVAMFFDHLSRDTPAENARLIFTTVPVELTCQDCGDVSTLDIDAETPVRPVLAAALNKGCPCGSGHIKITDGLGFEMCHLKLA